MTTSKITKTHEENSKGSGGVNKFIEGISHEALERGAHASNCTSTMMAEADSDRRIMNHTAGFAINFTHFKAGGVPHVSCCLTHAHPPSRGM
jgi:hypothetical protein